jgi:hypothetical protein
MSLPFFGRLTRAALSTRVLRDGFADGGVAWTGTARASASIMPALWSRPASTINARRGPSGLRFERLTGNLALSRLVNFNWQLRASADYDLLPSAQSSGPSARRSTAACPIGWRCGWGTGRASATGYDSVVPGRRSCCALPFAEFALTGDYAVRNRDWRVGLRIAFGALFDSGRRRYVMTPPGVAAGANAGGPRLHRQRWRRPFRTRRRNPRPKCPGRWRPQQCQVTGADGHALNHRDGHSRRRHTTARRHQGCRQSLSGRTAIRWSNSRRAPARCVAIPYPLRPAGEVYARLFLRQSGRGNRSVGAARAPRARWRPVPHLRDDGVRRLGRLHRRADQGPTGWRSIPIRRGACACGSRQPVTLSVAHRRRAGHRCGSSSSSRETP